MVRVRLPDGKALELPDGATVAEAIRAIGERLARDAVAAKINGRVVELFRRIDEPEVELQALTLKDPEGLEVARHSCAHVMAEAICSLWPQTRLVYGPPVENGFYYDIDLDHSLTPEDFKKIEARMAEIVKADRPFQRYELPRDEAMEKLRAEDNPYKVDNAERAEGDRLSFYATGEPGQCWEDLCRGPHVPSTRLVGAFKVMNVAGAYWHGDASKQMLQRVYGTTWPSKKELDTYLTRIEEAKKRDHRRLGQELGLFTLDAAVGPGLVLWKPRGAVVRHTLEQAIRAELLRRGYQPVYTPQIGKLDLYRTSGHYPYYKESQYPPLFESARAEQINRLWELARAAGSQASPEELALYRQLAEQYADVRDAGYPQGAPMDERLKRIRTWLAQEDGYLLRPMNCPHHVRIFASEPRSYRDLPCRLAEFGTVYRFEQSGEVHGMTRVRGFTQDDAHIFCTPDQLPAEIESCVDMARQMLETVQLTDYRVRVGLRDPASDKYIGSDDNWNRAEAALRSVVKAAGVNYTEEAGEAAFYGPKIDFVAKDCLGREWQLGTIQVDYNLPERFDLRYVGDDNTEHRPVMVHRAPLGSFERFVGILIEHFAGAFPLWLAPVQATLCTVSEKSNDYARQVFSLCGNAGLRIELDDSSDRIGAKVRRATLMKVPYIVVIGEQEAADGTLNVRTRDGRQLGSCKVAEFLHACAEEIASRGLKSLASPGPS
jgi:threonyl-tRNA synthetase